MTKRDQLATARYFLDLARRYRATQPAQADRFLAWAQHLVSVVHRRIYVERLTRKVNAWPKSIRWIGERVV